jgi:hypothetical protein
MNGAGYLGDEDRTGEETLTTFGRKYTRARLSRLLASAHLCGIRPGSAASPKAYGGLPKLCVRVEERGRPAIV